MLLRGSWGGVSIPRGPPALSVSVERGRPLGGQKIAEELGQCLLFPPGSQGAC